MDSVIEFFVTLAVCIGSLAIAWGFLAGSIAWTHFLWREATRTPSPERYASYTDIFDVVEIALKDKANAKVAIEIKDAMSDGL